MDADSMVFRHWEDVVFQNRNKNYGAYLLRRAYANRLLSGVCITIILFALILSLRNFIADDVIKPNAPLPLKEIGATLIHPPSVENKEKPRRTTTRPPRTNATNRTVLVTDEPEIAAITDFIPADGVEDGDLGIPDGIGTVPLAEPEPIIEPVVRDLAEVMPKYEGGLEAMMKFIQKKIRYPRVPQQLGIQGTVYVRFVVNGDGSISDVEVVRGVHPDYDKEAMRVISMLPSWKGGSHHGRPVKVRMVIPLKFNLQ
jgi:periplasmic protein TonB